MGADTVTRKKIGGKKMEMPLKSLDIMGIDLSTKEKDHNSVGVLYVSKGDRYVIGVCNSVEDAEVLIRENYGDNHKVFQHLDIRDSTLEYTKLIEYIDPNGSIESEEVTLEWFTVQKSIKTLNQ